MIFRFGVPALFRDVFLEYAQLGEADAQRVIDAVRSCSAGLQTQEQIAEAVQAAVPSFEKADLFVNGLTSFVGRWLDDPDEPAELAEAISTFPGLGLDAPEQAELARRLVPLVEADCLQLTAKAADVITSYENVYARARILTDIRPVFRRSDVDHPAAAVTVDTLKIEYYGPDSELTAFHVALDRADLVQLREAVDRALTKTESVARLLERAELPTWKERDEP